MTTIGALSEAQIRNELMRDGLTLDFGLARARIRSTVAPLATALRRLYAHFPIQPAHGFFDVDARLIRRRNWRSPFRTETQFVLDGIEPFDPLPPSTHLPMLEWGLNWCVSSRFHGYLLLHAGVVARDDLAIVIPAVPGTGKSTLTAALCARGFRLLSDEFGAIDPDKHRLMPVVRPIALKNESIAVIERFAPDAVLGPVFRNTRKGDVAHVAPDARSVAHRARPATPSLVIFPQYRAGAALTVEPMAQTLSFVKLSSNSFNYEVLGPRGFDAVARLVRQCGCYRVVYGDLEEAVACLSDLHRSRGTTQDAL